jgi:hypothetical protein
MRLKDFVIEADDSGPIGSFISGFKKGKDLNFTDKAPAASPEKKKLSNKAGTVDLQIDRYQLVDLQMVMQAVLKGNTNVLNTRQIQAAQELLTQLNNS